MRKLNYDDTPVDKKDGGDKAKNRFFAAQEEKRIKAEKNREDKHLLPREVFKDAKGKVVKDDFPKGKLPF